MTDWIWTEFVPEDPTCGNRAFECDLDWKDGSLMHECAGRIADLTIRFGAPAQDHGYTIAGPFDDGDYDEHAWFFNLEEHFLAYNKRFDYREGGFHEALGYGEIEAMTLTVFFRQSVNRSEFGLDMP